MVTVFVTDPLALDAPRCLCPPPADQMSLFTDDGYAIPHIPRPWQPRAPVTTSHCGRVGFWYRQTPQLFLGRRGAGPLILAPDTNVLIDLLNNLEDVGGLLGTPEPIFRYDWEDRLGAIHDLLQLWYWRDIRFWISELFVYDSRKPLGGQRVKSRISAFEEFARDMWERGGFDPQFDSEDDVDDYEPICPVHPAEPAPWEPPRDRPEKWPRGRLDRRLLRKGLVSGCHVFLSHDEGILACRTAVRAQGMEVMTPRELLEIVDASGDLVGYGPLLPDISALGRFWSLRGPEGSGVADPDEPNSPATTTASAA